MVHKVRKQNKIIETHLVDTRTLQLDINATSEKLNRSYAATDARVYNDVERDNASKELYKNVANIHQLFTQALDELENVNKVEHEKYNLETNVNQLQEMRIDLQQVTKDLAQVRRQLQRSGGPDLWLCSGKDREQGTCEEHEEIEICLRR